MIQLGNISGDPLSLLPGPPSFDFPLAPINQSGTWFTIVFPYDYFQVADLDKITISSSDWTLSVVSLTDPSDQTVYPALVVWLSSAITVEPDDTLYLTLDNVVPTGSVTSGNADLGVFFYNVSIGTPQAVDAGILPQFWMLAAAPGKNQQVLPLGVSWSVAQFASGDYGTDFSSTTIGRADGAVYYTPPAAPAAGIPNNVALTLNFADQNTALKYNGDSMLAVSVLYGPESDSQAPFLADANLLALQTDLEAAALVQTGPANGPQWSIGSYQTQGWLATWPISFPDGIVDPVNGQATVTLQLDTLVSRVASQPGATAVAVSWFGIPGYADGLVSLPMSIVAPEPAAILLTVPAGPVDYASQIDLTYVVYAAASAILTCRGESGTVVDVPPTLPGAGGLQMTGCAANPLSGADLNSDEVTFALVAVGYDQTDSTPCSAPALALSYTPPDFGGYIFSGNLTWDGAGDPTTTFTFPALSGVPAYSFSGLAGTPTVGGSATAAPPQLILADVLGGPVTATVPGPGGPYTYPGLLAQSWTPVTPPPVGTVLITAIGWGTIYTYGGDPLYFWTPGVAGLTPFGLDTGNGYLRDYNGTNFARMAQWPAQQDGTVLVSIPSPPAEGCSSPLISTVTVSWSPQTGLGSVGSPQLTSMINALPSGADGPLIVDGVYPSPLPAQYFPVAYNYGTSPVMTAYMPDGLAQIWFAGITASDQPPVQAYALNLSEALDTTSLKGAFIYQDQDGDQIFGFSVSQTIPPTCPVAYSCSGSLALPADVSVVDFDIDPVNQRFVSYAVSGGEDNDPTRIDIMVIPFGGAANSLITQGGPGIPGLPNAWPAFFQNQVYPIAVGRTTGNIYVVGLSPDRSSGMALYMVSSDGLSIFPLLGYSLEPANNHFGALLVVEPPD